MLLAAYLRMVFLWLFLLMLPGYLLANNFYFSSVYGNDNRTMEEAQDPDKPFRSLAKLDSIIPSLHPGDSVFFHRGEVFYGSLKVSIAGKPGYPIYFGAYGAGSDPVITGFTTLASWQLHTGKIYWASLDAGAFLNMVTLNGLAKGRGRFPNEGYLSYESHNGNLSITDYSLPSSPDWKGAEIVMRKHRFILDRHTVTQHTGNTLTYSLFGDSGTNTHSPVNGNGYFIQHHLGTLDQQGEWYYDAAEKRLYLHVGDDLPEALVVRASTRVANVTVSAADHLVFENLVFEGGNETGVSLNGGHNIVIRNCHFLNQGRYALLANHSNNVRVQGGTVSTSFSNGIFFEGNTNYCTVDGVRVEQTNTIPGTALSGTGKSVGITIHGNNNRISNNRVMNSGYNGIAFSGNHVQIENNVVDSFCMLKDDGGGIYTYVGNPDSLFTNRVIKNNIILNAIGAKIGAEANIYEPFGKAAGIYLDEYTNGVSMEGNVIARGDWGGIFLHNAYKCQFKGNLVIDHRYQVLVSNYKVHPRNHVMTKNQYVAKRLFQETFHYRTFVNEDPSAMGAFSENVYARPLNDSATILVDSVAVPSKGFLRFSLAQWQNTYRLDQRSSQSPISFTGNIDDSLRFEYNATNGPKTLYLSGSYRDLRGTPFAGELALAPFSGIVLLKSKISFLPGQVITFPAVPTTYLGAEPFPLEATATSGLAVSYRLVSGPAALAGNMVTLNDTGTVVIEAAQVGNGSVLPAPPVYQQFLVSLPKKEQAINFPALNNREFRNEPIGLMATASSNLTVLFRLVSGPATLNGSQLTLSGIGTVVLEAYQPGNNSYLPGAGVIRRFAVTRGTQSINFPSIADRPLSSVPFALTATATSGLPVSYKVSVGQATVSGNMLTMTGTGPVWIEASQEGNENFHAAGSTSQGFLVTSAITKKTQTITFLPLPEKTFGDVPFFLGATSTSLLPVAYRVVQGPAMVSGNKLTLTGAGDVLLEAMQDGNDNFLAAPPVQQHLTVKKKSQTIFFRPMADQTYGQAPFFVPATASSGLPVRLSVTKGPAIIVDGLLILKGTGEVWVQAAQDGNNDYHNAASQSKNFYSNLSIQGSSTQYQWTCPSEPTSLTAPVGAEGALYQWQVNRNDGKGFLALTDNTLYSGSATSTLRLTSTPSSIYGFAYRCKITYLQQLSYTAETVVKLYLLWTGSANAAWENAVNWSCQTLPDGNTDVYVPAGTIPPVISNAAFCRSIRLGPGAFLEIQKGKILTVVGK